MSMSYGTAHERIAAPAPVVIVEYRPVDGRWVVRQEGSKRITSMHSTRSDAEHVARRLARNQRKDVAILLPDGILETRYSYSSLRNRSRLIRSPRESF